MLMKPDEEKGASPAGWNFHRKDATDVIPAAAEAAPEQRPLSQRREALRWTASEAVQQRPSGWLAMVFAGALAIAALSYLVTKDMFTALVIPAVILLFGAYNARKPQSLQYQLDGGSIMIGQRRYALSQFRSFGIDQDHTVHNIVLAPLKRFMPELTINYTPELEEPIVNILADALPMEAPRHDFIDMLLRKLRF